VLTTKGFNPPPFSFILTLSFFAPLLLCCSKPARATGERVQPHPQEQVRGLVTCQPSPGKRGRSRTPARGLKSVCPGDPSACWKRKGRLGGESGCGVCLSFACWRLAPGPTPLQRPPGGAHVTPACPYACRLRRGGLRGVAVRPREERPKNVGGRQPSAPLSLFAATLFFFTRLSSSFPPSPRPPWLVKLSMSR